MTSAATDARMQMHTDELKRRARLNDADAILAVERANDIVERSDAQWRHFDDDQSARCVVE